MSSKKKLLKCSQTDGTTPEEDVTHVATADMILPFVRDMSLNNKDQEAVFRPAHSRIVNWNCLRPYGALQEEELGAHFHFSEPPESVLRDILAMVNDSQRLLRRSPDLALAIDSNDTVGILHADAFRHWWLDSVAKECRSASAFPFTEFRFMVPLSQSCTNAATLGGNVFQTCTHTAKIIYHILYVFADVSNNGQWYFEELLFHALQNEKASIRGLLSVNYNSRHITVCCGLYFYSVDVLNEDGSLVPIDIVAERLRAVKIHADLTERGLCQTKLLPDALEDLVTFYKLLGHLTEIDRVECAAVMERLRNADPVNAASLTAIDTGIFTLVLRGLDNKAPSARWYRSSLVLEEEETEGVFKLRGHSTIIHGDDLMEFLMRVISVDVKHENFTETKGDLVDGEGRSTSDDSLPSGVVYLEMWLPWKHRKPMRPYAEVLSSPCPFPLSLPRERRISFTSLCMSAVLAVQQLITSCDEFPSVLVAFPRRKGGLSAALLYSFEVESFIQSLRCGSALVERRTIQQLAKRALQSLEGIIDACFHEPYPMYSMAKLLLFKGTAVASDSVTDGSFLGTVDLCITVSMLGSSGSVLECETTLFLPSRFSLICSAVGNYQQKSSVKKGPSGADLKCASLKAHERNDVLSMGGQLTECIVEKSLLLSSLLPNECSS